jgi:hypothetical protein
MILVCLLSYRRPAYLERTLESFRSQNGALIGTQLRLIALDQCGSAETAAVFQAYRDCLEKVYTSEANLGIGWGFSQLVELSHLYKAGLILFLEDDWLCQVALSKHLEHILWLFRSAPDVGTLRLRTIEDAVATVNHVTEEPVHKERRGEDFLVGNYHYVFNPHLVRAEVARAMIPVAGEHHAQLRYYDLGLQGAQLVDRMFVHIGEQRAPGRISRVTAPEPVVPHTSVTDAGAFLVPLPARGVDEP